MNLRTHKKQTGEGKQFVTSGTLDGPADVVEDADHNVTVEVAIPEEMVQGRGEQALLQVAE
jgi:hypothetical protein